MWQIIKNIEQTSKKQSWIIVMFLSAVWTLVLTAPIHYMDPLVSKWCNAKFLQISFFVKKQTYLHFVWSESEYILSKFAFLGELFL